MPKPGLGQLQLDFLREFFSRESSFYLSGGAALVGFYLAHRETHDLDLFTLGNSVEEGARLIRETAESLDAEVEPIQTSPDFRRYLISRGDESISVDLIREYVYQLNDTKEMLDGIRIDSPIEIFANKLCAVLSRSEIRDIVDIRELEAAGFDLETALAAAEKKDSGLTAAQLAWVLSQIKLTETASLPGEVSVAELRAYIAALIVRLQKLALPS